jgi:hypothetical protein
MEMNAFKSTALGFTIALLANGCGDRPAAPTTAANPPAVEGEGEHIHGKGPNGGVIFDFGRYHAEFTVNHERKECTVVVLSGENEQAKPKEVSAKELMLTTLETKTKEGKVVPPMTIVLKPVDEKDGKAAKFTGTDPGLGNVADFAGTVAGEVNRKPAKGEFKE